MTVPATSSKLQELIEKWGLKSAVLLLGLLAFIYTQDRAQMSKDTAEIAARLNQDNAALSARVGASERAIGRLQEGKASREELKAAIDSIRNDNQRGRDDFKDTVNTLRNDLVGRIDLMRMSAPLNTGRR